MLAIVVNASATKPNAEDKHKHGFIRQTHWYYCHMTVSVCPPYLIDLVKA